MKIKIGIIAVLMVISSLEVSKAQTKQVVAYFPEWGVERQFPYYVKQVGKSGAADKLTVLIYAFCEPAPDSTGAIEPKFKNAYEAYQQIYSADMSIDGVADDSTQALRGQFNQLKKLKAQHSKLKVLISIGGWTGSGYFSDALLTQQTREKFADAIIDRYILGNLPVVNGAGGKGVAAHIFDGIDIDWEYPIHDGLDGNHHDSNDNNNLSAFYSLMRKKLDSINRKLLMTAAVPASELHACDYNITRDQKYLSWYNIMTYDFVGEWSPVTNHQTNLLTSPYDTSGAPLSLDKSVRLFIDSLGVSRRKIVPGAAFYGHGWKDVDSINAGLYRQAGGGASRDEEGESRNYSYWSSLLSKGYVYHWDTLAMAPWLYNPHEHVFWSFDDAKSIALKSRYVDAYHLGGIMCWEISGDDSSGTLINAMHSGEMPDTKFKSHHLGKSSASIQISIAASSNQLVEGCNVIINTRVMDAKDSVVKVQYFVDGKSIGYDTGLPFDWVWFNAHHGTHRIKAVATDDKNNGTISNTVEIKLPENKSAVHK